MLTALRSRAAAATRRWWVARASGATDRADALGLLLLGLVLLALDVGGVGPTVPVLDLPAPRWWQAGLLLVAVLVLVAKRRRPLAVLLAVTGLAVVDALLGGSLGMYLVLFDALFAVAVHGAPRVRRAVQGVVGGAVLAAAVALVVAGGSARDVVQLVLVLVAMFLTPFWWGGDVRRTEELARSEARRADLERERADLARAHADDVARIAALDRTSAVQDERRRMARDLHDAVAGHLSAVAIHAEAALAGRPDPDRDRAALRAVRAGALDALTEMRAMILVLRAGDDADDVPAPPGLDRVPSLDADVDPAALPVVSAAVGQTAYRIAQEAVTNAHKHGAGRPALTVRTDERTLHLEVRNAMPVVAAASPVPSSSTGLTTMRERAATLGGTVTAGPEGDAWVVRAVLPLDPATDAGAAGAAGEAGARARSGVRA
ncbi:two-component sensor histidine kinase [Cellulomonas sp. JZ18]|uniref:sensor histidine kinase n=1 Tax=Cellulomonas sp. JZ18 TaxID=2654191 RepID=UPI0012D4842E|nr:histidine kinase [Cellulomonas sp. JZ18]QGQ18032.1 two-component sensor histidine kinase [Cellulomonas sp. JZ18]